MFTTVIPTKYKNIQFRSRLEARWAAFFDLLEWNWDYEPVDLNGYIPDFILPDFCKSLIIEVKPSLQIEDLYQYTSKIENSGWEHSSLIVGSKLFEDADWGNLLLGILFHNRNWSSSRLMYCRSSSHWRNSIASLDDNGFGVCVHADNSCAVADWSGFGRELWNEAGNMVQYKSPVLQKQK